MDCSFKISTFSTVARKQGTQPLLFHFWTKMSTIIHKSTWEGVIRRSEPLIPKKRLYWTFTRIPAQRMRNLVALSDISSKVIYLWLSDVCSWLFFLIIIQSVLFVYLQDPEVGKLSQFEVFLCRKTVKRVILKLVKLVENLIANEPSKAKEAFILDGWTSSSMHYIAVPAQYNTQFRSRSCRENSPNTIPLLELLSLSPMSKA